MKKTMKNFWLASLDMSIAKPFFKLTMSLLIVLFPALAWGGTQSINFTPPATDLSVTFLTDIFGMVDGVLYGGGSQIMGSMFSLFNASILALGGMVLIYTTTVATINTAGEGQVLGKDWNSIWIPVRTTIGLSLLFTYSSGYSVLQIFVMWIVVQGVGAGDLIWNAALGYLQRGGVIVQPMASSSTDVSTIVDSATIYTGASDILTGITCLTALQQQISNMYTSYSAQANSSSPSGPCANLPSSGGTQDQVNMRALCETGVITLVDSSSVMTAQSAAMAGCTSCTVPTGETDSSGTAVTENCLVQCSKTTSSGTSTPCVQGTDGCSCQACDTSSSAGCQVNSTCTSNPGAVSCSADTSLSTCQSPVTLPLPNLPSTSPYYALNGICGTITWNLMNEVACPTSSTQSTVTSASSELGLSEQSEMTMANSRAIGVAQMYTDLTPVAQNIVQNDLTLSSSGSVNCNSASGTLCYFSSSAYSVTSPLGVPAISSGSLSPTCTGLVSPNPCQDWVTPKTGFTELLTGVELPGAVSDYNSIMAPTLNAICNTSTIAASTEFVTTAESRGWIMAGSYFFNLEQVNQNDATTTSSGTLIDTDSGLGGSSGPKMSNFCSKGSTSTSGSLLCTWYGAGDSTNTSLINDYNNQIITLMQGPTPDNLSATVPAPTYQTKNPPTAQSWPIVYTSELNTTVFGYESNASNMLMQGQVALVPVSLPAAPAPVDVPAPSYSGFNCNSQWGYYGIPGMICESLGNGIIVGIINTILYYAAQTLQKLLYYLVYVPLTDLYELLSDSLTMMTSYSSNPILSLATTGVQFINTCLSVWTTLSISMAVMGITGIAGPVVLIAVAIIGPFVLTWFGMIFSMGIAMAYYVPLLPYVLFTFGAFGWMVGVVEAMAAAPIVALGVMLPEGHSVFGQGKESLMLIFNAFLRPGMMIIGYVAAIILSTVGIWMINSGFSYMQTEYLSVALGGSSTGGFAYYCSYFFLFAMYITMCIGIIERAFELIYKLPDRVLQWIGGGMQSAFGSDVVGNIAQKTEGKADETGKAMQSAASQKRSFGEGGGGKSGGGNSGVGGGAGPGAGGQGEEGDGLQVGRNP